MMTRRSLTTALVVSLGLHLGLVLWARQRPRPLPPAPASRPLEVDIVVSAPPEVPGAPRPAVRPPLAMAPLPAPARPRGAEAPPARLPGAPAEVPFARSGGEGAPAVGGPEAPRAPAHPRGLPVPRSDFTLSIPSGLAEGAAPMALPGHTQRAGDPQESRDARLAREGLEGGARLEEWVTESAAEGRVREGRMHPYYGELRRALREQVRTPPGGLPLPQVPQDVLAEYLKRAQRYGAGGAPVGDAAPGVERQLQTIAQGLPALERELARDPGLASGAGGRRMARVGESSGSMLRAVVELRQAPDGSFTGQVLLTSSGNPLFDRFVLERAPQAVLGLASPPPDLSPGGLRSTWAFEGRVTYRRKLRDFKLPEDAGYLAALLGTGQLGGSFDLANLRDTEVPDLRHPRWEITPVPLKVY